MELGYALIYLADEAQGGDLLERIKNLRKQMAQELGIMIPSVHVRDNLSLKPGEYQILIKGVEIAKGELLPNYYLAIPPVLIFCLLKEQSPLLNLLLE